MINVVKINIKDTIKNPSYLLILAITFIIPLNSIVQMSKSYSTTGGTSFMLVFTYLAFNITIFSFLTSVCITFIVISEKTSGRCEYYLANQTNLLTLVKSYSLSSFLLCFLPLVAFNGLVLIIASIMNITSLIDIIISFRFVMFFAVLILFCLSSILFLTVLTMIAKKPEKIRFYLSLFSFSNIYVTILPMKLLVQKGFTFENSTILHLITITLMIMSAFFTILLFFISKRLNSETVVLSYKQ